MENFILIILAIVTEYGLNRLRLFPEDAAAIGTSLCSVGLAP